MHTVTKPHRLLIIFLLLFVSQGLGAQEADTLEASAIYSVKVRPVVPATEEVYLPSQVAVPPLVSDVIRRFSGVQVKDYGGVGGLKTVNVRSLGSEHTGIFLDGIQVDNAQNMQVDLGRFSTDGIGKVSLYNGQKTRRLQTAKEYACGVAIHLDSNIPSHLDGSGGIVRLRGGSFGTINPSIQWDKHFRRLTLSSSAEFLRSNGKYRFPFFDTTLVRENGDIRSLRLESRLFGQVRGGDWMLRAYGYGSERGFPGPVVRRGTGLPLSAERQSDQDFFIQGGWNQDWLPRYSTALKFKYSDSYTHYNTHPEKNPMAMPWDVNYRQRAAYVSVAQSFIPADEWSVDLSVDIQHNILRSNAGQQMNPQRTAVTGALAGRMSLEKVRAAAHLVYMGAWDWFSSQREGAWYRDRAFRGAWMPSLSLYYSPVKWIELDAFVKRSYRLPSFNDLYYVQIGNASLSPESAFQTGLDIRLAKDFRGWHAEGRISPYYNRVTNKILAIPTYSQFRWSMSNIGKVDINGLDVKLNAGTSLNGWSLDATARYTFQKALDHSDHEKITYGNQIPYVPVHSGSVDLLVSKGPWSFTWNSIFTGGRWSLTANLPDYYIKPWTTSDVSIFRKAPLLLNRWKRVFLPQISTGITVSNIFNGHYQIVQGYPMPGTNFMIVLEFSW